MPRTIEVTGEKRSVATEEELLAFANSIREAGGAGVLEALLPSEPGNSAKCLIANALNFGCEVCATETHFADGSQKWVMRLPKNLTVEQRTALKKVKGVRLLRERDIDEFGEGYCLSLPRHIGNAALAFDYRMAFESYAVNP